MSSTVKTKERNVVGSSPSRGFRSWALIAGAALGLATLSAKWSTQPSTDYAVCSMNDSIYTVDTANPTVQCIVVHDTRITDVGQLADVKARWRRQTSRPMVGFQLPWPLDFWKPSLKVSFVDPSSVVIPGLADAHAHVLLYGSVKMNVDLAGCTSKQEALERLVSYVKSHPAILNDPSRWIRGMGWDQTLWKTPEYPHADDFDTEPFLRGRRIHLSRVDGHAAWVSNRALQLMGHLPKSVDGGEIIRDSSGKPTGILVDNAMSLVSLPPPSKEEISQYFDRAMKDALAVGLTSIHDADTEHYGIEFYKEYAASKKFPLRMYLMGHVESNEYWGDRLPRLVNYGVGERLNFRGVKLYADGALGSFGAALLEPYSDNPSTNGLMLTQPAVLADLVKRFHTDGWQVNIHCIGDRGNHIVLDIFEDVFSGSNITEFRPRIEHAQIMTLDDLERVGRLGVIPSVQPTHATSDMWYAEQRLGPDRIKGAYAYRTMIETSRTGVLPLGSDFPIESINPLLGFYAAVTRLSVSGQSPHGVQGWYPDERLTRFQALKGMTLDAAYASFSESILGSLTVGKQADFVVLDRDIMTIPASEIPDTKVMATVIGGEVAYGSL
ncbi:amidohydrolase family-domain-containing protein [Scleroderma yunnanense]